MTTEIRAERPADKAAVRAVVKAAFGRDDEADLVDALRGDNDIALALVAEDGGTMTGHIVLSRLLAPARALALAPVSVLPAHQGRGIGSALIREALRLARQAGWQSVFLLGEPAYYSRFGFRRELAAGFASPYTGAYFMALELRHGALDGGGNVIYAPAFAAL